MEIFIESIVVILFIVGGTALMLTGIKMVLGKT